MSAEDKARLAALEAENAKLKKEAADFAEAQAVARRTALHAENVAFAETLVKAGKLLPVNKDQTVALMDNLAEHESAVEFGEGDGKKSLAPLAIYKVQMEALPKVVEFEELAGGAAADDKEMSPEVMAAKAVAFQESEAQAGRQITTAQAVQHVKSVSTKA